MLKMNPELGTAANVDVDAGADLKKDLSLDVEMALSANLNSSPSLSSIPTDRVDAVNTEMSAKLNPREMKNEPLLEQLGKLAKAERELTAEVIEFIAEVQRRRLYLSQNCTSLFAFLTCRLGYSESAAQRRIEAARLLLEVPELKDDLKSGELNLSQVGVVAQGLRQQEQQQERTQAQKPPSPQPQPSQVSQQPPPPPVVSAMTKPTAELKRELLAQVKGQSVAEAQGPAAFTCPVEEAGGFSARSVLSVAGSGDEPTVRVDVSIANRSCAGVVGGWE